MKTEHAVRYLVLRHLWLLRDRVREGKQGAIAASLLVESDPEGYRVRWRDAGIPHERLIPKGDLVLYQRGDAGEKSRGATGRDQDNERVAEDFARTVLGLEPRGEQAGPRAATRWPYARFIIVGNLLLLLAMAAPAPAQLVGSSGVLAGMLLAEFRPRWSRPLMPLLALAFVPAGFPHMGAASALALAGVSILDPDGRQRGLRAASSLAVAGVASLAAWFAGSGQWTPGFAGLACLALAAATARSLIGVHVRSYPLLLPAACLGLALDGWTLAAALGLVGAVIGIAGLGILGKLRPVQTAPGAAR